mmetsp:Transcript_39876/g.105781  ORF Transcript_39876/g.105781 Transcript_39876/m.105781 type:complete len:288 (+) Transcript_39876:480-1343(+)
MTDFKRLQRIGYVGKVEEHLQPGQGVFPQHLVRVVVPQQVRNTGLQITDVSIHLVELVQTLHHVEMFGHVRVQDRFDADLPCHLEDISRQTLEHVGLCVAADLKELRTMHVLQGGLVIVAQSQHVPALNQERVRHSEVTDVMTECRHQDGELLRIAEPLSRHRLAQDAVDTVKDVTGMSEVVVRVGTVACFHSVQERSHGAHVDQVTEGRKTHGCVEDDVKCKFLLVFAIQGQEVDVPGRNSLRGNLLGQGQHDEFLQGHHVIIRTLDAPSPATHSLRVMLPGSFDL